VAVSERKEALAAPFIEDGRDGSLLQPVPWNRHLSHQVARALPEVRLRKTT
jgi:hypothetical protein